MFFVAWFYTWKLFAKANSDVFFPWQLKANILLLAICLLIPWGIWWWPFFPVWIPIIYKNTTLIVCTWWNGELCYKQSPSPKRVSGVAFGMSPQLREGWCDSEQNLRRSWWCAWDSSMWNHFSPGLIREKLPTNLAWTVGKGELSCLFFAQIFFCLYQKLNRFSFCKIKF